MHSNINFTNRYLKIILVSLFLQCTYVFSQNPIQFQHTYGTFDYNYGMCIKQTADSGYVILANVSGNQNSSNVYLFKIDMFGAYVWDKLFSDTAVFWAEKMEKTPDNGFIITGYTNKLPNMGYSMFLLKTDSTGNKEWIRYYGGADWDLAMDVTSDAFGNLYLTGSTYSFGSGESDVFIMKCNSNGDSLWTKTYGGAYDDVGRSIIVCDNGDVVVAGYTNSFGAGDYDALILRYENDGTFLWANTYGGVDDDKAYDIKEKQNGNLIMGGYAKSFGSGTAYMYFVEVFSDGILNWQEVDGWWGGHHGEDKAFSLDLTFDNGHIFAGTSTFNVYQDIFIFKTDSVGQWDFSTSHGGLAADDANYIIQTFDSCYIIVGTSEWYGKNLKNIYVIKTGIDGLSEPYNNIAQHNDDTMECVSVYPNPIYDVSNVNFNCNCQTFCTFMVYDITGKNVYTYSIQSHESDIKLDRKMFKQGIYFFKYLDNIQIIGSGSFVVR